MKIQPIRTKEEYEAAVEAAKADNNHLIAPSHLVLKDNIIHGTLSFVPSVLVWMDSKKNRVRDSIQMKEFVEGHLAANGQRLMLMPCTKESPYHALLTKDGFINLGSFDFFLKGI